VLLETVIASFLLGAALLSLARLSLGASWMVRQGRWRSAAAALACQTMEHLVALGFQQQVPGQIVDPENPLGEDGTHDPQGKFLRSWSVTLIEPGLNLIVVEVRWELPRPGSVEMASLSGRDRGETPP
jgi:hypothetical protein